MAPLSDISLMTPVIATINHLLAQEPWARQQLAVHAGKLACIDTGAVALRLRVDSAGLLVAAPADLPANVTIRVKLSDVPLILQNRE
ncbi:MAG: sterol-binding protein, partial [Janthinobacterium sp.]